MARMIQTPGLEVSDRESIGNASNASCRRLCQERRNLKQRTCRRRAKLRFRASVAPPHLNPSHQLLGEDLLSLLSINNMNTRLISSQFRGT